MNGGPDFYGPDGITLSITYDDASKTVTDHIAGTSRPYTVEEIKQAQERADAARDKAAVRAIITDVQTEIEENIQPVIDRLAGLATRTADQRDVLVLARTIKRTLQGLIYVSRLLKRWD